MLFKDLKAFKDPEIRQKGVNLLYNSKKLSNQNIDCYVTGFKDVVNCAEFEIRDMIEGISEYIKNDLESINMSCSYRCRDYTDSEKRTRKQYRKLTELLDTLRDYIDQEDIKLTFKI